MKFPYRLHPIAPTRSIPDGIIVRPMIPLRVIGPLGAIPIRALLDSGADETLFPRSIADAIGIEIDQNEAWAFAGIGGQSLRAAPGAVRLELSDRARTVRWTAVVQFAAFPIHRMRWPFLATPVFCGTSQQRLTVANAK
jgi:hypothetical protein